MPHGSIGAALFGRRWVGDADGHTASYRDEIFGAISKAGHSILHVFLDVSAAELCRRIEAQVLIDDNPQADAEARRFRLDNVDRGVAARCELPADALVLKGDQHSPAELADRVLQALRPSAHGSTGTAAERGGH